MFFYTAYGLGIHSALSVPAFVPGAASQDITILRGEVDRTASAGESKDDFVIRANSQEVYFGWEKVGACLVRDGREIIVDINPDVDEQMIAPLIPILPLAMLLHQRGLLILHASAVAIDGGVVAFLGKSGQGKSTTAGALHQLGYPLVTDDVLAIDFDDAGYARVFPSFPHLRLWPESAVALGNSLESLPSVYPHLEKRDRSVTDSFQPTPLPLKRLYVLSDGNALDVETLSPQSAFLEIMGQSYPGQALLKATNTAAAKFHRGVKLANSASICRLSRPRSLSQLSQLARFIEQDLNQNCLQSCL